MDLRGKIALVTGGAVRVGRALTLALAQSGADVFVNYRSSATEAEAVVREARAYGVRAWSIQADLSDHAAVARLIQAVEEAAGGVDVLVNSASPFIHARLADTTLEVWRMVMGVLLDGPFLLCRAFAPGMVARGGGLIVNILDQSAFHPDPAYFAHTIGKTGLLGMTRALAMELAPAVRVNAIVPGPVLPPPDFTPEQESRIAQSTLLRRWGTPEDVAHALRYLLEADYVTGETLFVDGGEALK